MYVVQSRVNGALIDEERCGTLSEAWDAIGRRRRMLVNGCAAIISEDARQHIIARSPDGWITVMLTVRESS